MDDSVFLTNIRLTQFRSFAELDIDLPAEPAVLIVHGSNGLGKSSLFDALEWTLTDKIDHFRDVNGVKKVGKYLCRWRDGDLGPTSAAMTFSDGSSIERMLSSADAMQSTRGGNIEDIGAFLRAPTWDHTIQSLQHYLLLTHFLGQSTLSRLTHRTAAERFEMLKEAAQSREIEELAIALHGKGNTMASKAFTRRIDQLEKEVGRLDELLVQEAELWEGAQAEGALDPAGVATLGRTIVVEIEAARAELALGRISRQGTGAIDLSELTAIWNDVRAQVRDREAQLRRAEQLVEGWGRSTTLLAETSAALEETQTEQIRLAAQSQQLTAARIPQQRVAAQALEVQAAAVARFNLLNTLRAAVDYYREQRNKAAEADANVETAEVSHLKAEREASILDRRGAIVAKLRADTDRVTKELAEAHRQRDRYKQWLDRAEKLDQLRRAINDDRTRFPDLERTVRELEILEQDALSREASQREALRQLQEVTGAISQAVTTIATQLPKDACDCPVCATHFDEPSRLRERASGAAERLAPLLVAQEQHVARAIEEREALTARLAHQRAVLARIFSTEEKIATDVAANADLEAVLGAVGTLDVAAVTQLRDAAVQGSDRLSWRLRRLKYWRQRLTDVSGTPLTQALAGAIKRRDDLARVRESSSRRASHARQAAEAALSNVIAHEGMLGLGAGAADHDHKRAYIAGESALAEAKADADQATKALAETDAALSEARTQDASLAARIADLTLRIADHRRAFDDDRRAWVELGFTGAQPDPGEVDGGKAALVNAIERLDRARDVMRRIADGAAAWARQESHRSALERLREAIDGAPNSSRDQIRTAAETVAGTQRRLKEATTETKVIARAASFDILDQVADFNAAYIEPLDELMKQINLAILCDPRIGIDLQVKNKKIEQVAYKTGEVPAGMGDIDPALVHSEGQMAALGVSMLAAASLTYPWSRWRALILDDPLQHNDAIHASAFADLMGNIVRDCRYQLLLSTHDVAQAEFLRRKFDSRRIPCSLLNLLGTGREGVEWTLRPPRMAVPHVAVG
ncbi:AAA family ATPase [Caballeronia novacaledonica]|uniref:AAA family ATPase n=1 Tax=Caballeronia novacaledonica TaxID=1544861 RepID=A0AA37IHQ4_9BURK|nr:AAA family ATPase [Caballeronia novacaledonica]GJH26981.1 AAA family ATPase [Caballeronia novacaledonica]